MKKVNLAISVLITIFFMMVGNILNAQELSVHQGFWKMKYYEDSEEITKQQFEKKIMTVPAASHHYNKYKSNVTLGSVFSGIGAGLTAAVIINNNNNPGNNNTGLLIGGLAGYIGGLALIFSANKNIKDATLSYNSAVTHNRYKIEPSRDKVGIVLTF